MEIHEHVLLAALTTFQIGGPARYFTEVYADADIRDALTWARERQVPFAIFSGGSNVLVSDEGFSGLVLHMRGSDVKWEGITCTVSAGKNMRELIEESGVRGVGGWEKLTGIPGTIGGAVRGNAGAFGSEIRDFVTSVRCINSTTFEEKIFLPDECAFAYRMSFFKTHPEWIIVEMVLALSVVDPNESAQASSATITEREKRHLQNVRAAGSYFMNPVAPRHIQELFEKEKGVTAREGRVPAGWLIEKAGMKGSCVGGAQSSLQHADYLVNVDNATSADVRMLAENIQHAVFETFGIQLHEEAVIL